MALPQDMMHPLLGDLSYVAPGESARGLTPATLALAGAGAVMSYSGLGGTLDTISRASNRVADISEATPIGRRAVIAGCLGLAGLAIAGRAYGNSAKDLLTGTMEEREAELAERHRQQLDEAYGFHPPGTYPQVLERIEQVGRSEGEEMLLPVLDGWKIYFLNADYSGAVSHWTKIVEDNPNPSETDSKWIGQAAYAVGLTRFRLGLFDRTTRAWFEKAVALGYDFDSNATRGCNSAYETNPREYVESMDNFARLGEDMDSGVIEDRTGTTLLRIWYPRRGSGTARYLFDNQQRVREAFTAAARQWVGFESHVPGKNLIIEHHRGRRDTLLRSLRAIRYNSEFGDGQLAFNSSTLLQADILPRYLERGQVEYWLEAPLGHALLGHETSQIIVPSETTLFPALDEGFVDLGRYHLPGTGMENLDSDIRLLQRKGLRSTSDWMSLGWLGTDRSGYAQAALLAFYMLEHYGKGKRAAIIQAVREFNGFGPISEAIAQQYGVSGPIHPDESGNLMSMFIPIAALHDQLYGGPWQQTIMDLAARYR